MALVNIPNSDSKFQSGQPAYGTDVSGNVNALVNDYNGNITNANIATNASIVDTKLAAISTAGKVSGAALVSLGDIPNTAGVIPAANLPSASAVIPSGVIVMWSGTIATIPSGWFLCNGTNSTPNLVDRFIVGAKQDDSGVAKSNIVGLRDATTTLTQSGNSNIRSITTTFPHFSTPGGTGSTGTVGYGGSPDVVMTANEGIGVETYPRYYALAYIMKS
jgi:hypothetical protein